MTTVPPIVTADELAAHLGGAPDPDRCELAASSASELLAAVVDQYVDEATGDPYPWPDHVREAGVLIAADLYKYGAAPGGGAYQLDEFTVNNVPVTSALLRRYEAVYNPSRAVGGMVG